MYKDEEEEEEEAQRKSATNATASNPINVPRTRYFFDACLTFDFAICFHKNPKNREERVRRKEERDQSLLRKRLRLDVTQGERARAGLRFFIFIFCFLLEKAVGPSLCGVQLKDVLS